MEYGGVNTKGRLHDESHGIYYGMVIIGVGGYTWTPLLTDCFYWGDGRVHFSPSHFVNVGMKWSGLGSWWLSCVGVFRFGRLARCALQLVALLACTPFFLAMLQVRNENLHKSTLLSNEYLLCYMSVMCRDAAKGRHERSFKPRQVRHVNIPVRPAVVNVNNSLLR